MKIRDEFVMIDLPDMAMVVPVGSQAKNFNGALKLNETGAFIFEHLQRGQSVVQTAQALAEAYEVSVEQAEADVQTVVDNFIKNGVAEI